MDQIDIPFRLVTEQLLPHGQLAAISMPAASSTPMTDETLREGLDRLLPEERALALALALPRRASFVGGRLALRSVLAKVQPGLDTTPILRTARGAPLLPPPVVGSVSHKRRLAVALAAVPSPDVQTLGVDLEEVPDESELLRPDLARKILTARERHALAELETSDALAYRVAVRLRFALKEAVYKAIDPHVQRYVRFQEVEVEPSDSGETRVVLSLPEFVGRDITVRAWWTRLGDHLVASAIGSSLSE
jgi:enterobactin synthetase component D